MPYEQIKMTSSEHLRLKDLINEAVGSGGSITPGSIAGDEVFEYVTHLISEAYELGKRHQNKERDDDTK